MIKILLFNVCHAKMFININTQACIQKFGTPNLVKQWSSLYTIPTDILRERMTSTYAHDNLH